MKNLIKKVLVKSTVKPIVENEYIPPMHINDVERMQFFTNYNLQLLNEIRRIKLNQL
jgi:hypothetical protein